MKINEIIIIVVSVLIVPLVIVYSQDKIGTRTKQIIGGLYAIFALVSMILSAIEAHTLKKPRKEDGATGEEVSEYTKSNLKAIGLAFLGAVLMVGGVYSIFDVSKK